MTRSIYTACWYSYCLQIVRVSNDISIDKIVLYGLDDGFEAYQQVLSTHLAR